MPSAAVNSILRVNVGICTKDTFSHGRAHLKMYQKLKTVQKCKTINYTLTTCSKNEKKKKKKKKKNQHITNRSLNEWFFLSSLKNIHVHYLLNAQRWK